MSVLDFVVRGDVGALTQHLQEHPEATHALLAMPWGTMPPLHVVVNGPFQGLRLGGVAPELARALLHAEADMEGALSSAVSLGATDVARVLLEHGADVHEPVAYPGLQGGTPLDLAVQFGMVDCVDLLVAHGARVDTLRRAAGAGHLEELRRHLDEAAPIAQHDAFRVAVVCGRVDIVRTLLGHGMALDATLDAGGTALHWAAWEAKSRMVRFLLLQGADPSATDPAHQMTPYQWAQVRAEERGPHGGHADVIAVLSGWTAEASARKVLQD